MSKKSLLPFLCLILLSPATALGETPSPPSTQNGTPPVQKPTTPASVENTSGFVHPEFPMRTMNPYVTYIKWDLTAQFGLIPFCIKSDCTPYDISVAQGILFEAFTYFYSFDLILSYQGKMLGGFRGNITSLSEGYWAEGTVQISENADFLVSASVGWSFFGVKYQQWIPTHDHTNFTGKKGIVFFLTVPIGLVFQSLF